MGSTAVADFGISILLSAPTYTLTQIQLAQVYVDTQGRDETEVSGYGTVSYTIEQKH
jgi:hypothetical protein